MGFGLGAGLKPRAMRATSLCQPERVGDRPKGMRLTSGVLVAAILGFASSSWAGQQSVPPPTSKDAPTQQDLERAARELAQAMARQFAFDNQKPTLNCGLTLIPPDPKQDAKIRIPPTTGVTPTIRSVPPPMCRANRTQPFKLPITPTLGPR